VTFRVRDEDKRIIDCMLRDLAEVIYLLPNKTLDPKNLERIRVIITGSGLDIPDFVLEKAENLELIQTLSAGVDTLPLDRIPPNVIICSNAGGNSRAVAEHVFAMILSAIKRIIYHHKNMEKGIWERRRYGSMLMGKTLGIIGLGHVGREIAKIGKCFGMRIYGINRSGKTDVDVDFIGTPESLDFVLRESDIIVISVPLNKYTRGLIGAKELNTMKKNTILVNVSRGEVIDQRALFEHLRRNPEFVACLDVWWKYPEKDTKTCLQDFPFHTLPNVIMTPHIAGFAREIREQVIKHAVENVRKYLLGEKISNIVRREDYL